MLEVELALALPLPLLLHAAATTTTAIPRLAVVIALSLNPMAFTYFATTSTLICDICFDGHPQICLGCSHSTGAGARANYLVSRNACAFCIRATPVRFPHCGIKQ